MTLVTVFMVLFGTYLTAYVAYQALLFAANATIADPVSFEPSGRRRFNVLVPAHNEELFLPRLLASLRTQSYPADRYRVTVIADNCTDGTATVARAVGVDVLERVDAERRGKGHAIGWAIERLDLPATDALVIVDGDSTVRPDFLEQLNLQMERGDEVIQCYNGVANPGQSWFTRLMNVSRTIANEILHPAKRKLGLSSHLMGNGMCFSSRLIQSLGWGAFTVGEDWEYYARLVLSGTPVGYCRDARVYHQESVNLRQASAQRLRWSGGRLQVLRQFGGALFLQGLKRRDLMCLDASLPLVFPNPSLGMNLTLVGSVAAAGLWLITGEVGILAWLTVLAAAQVAMFLVGACYTADRLASAMSLFVAPAFLAWKFGIDLLSMGGAGTKQWKPTARKIS
jgi:cellulose synthase/poly-beta-1,6-N-acetylglucosamine synthase-like glycosyltransferase